jgi:Ca2+-binding RTX toxin-like protein
MQTQQNLIEAVESRVLFALTVTEGYPGMWEIHDSVFSNATVDVVMTDLPGEHSGMWVNNTYYSPVDHVAIFTYEGTDDVSIDASGGDPTFGASVVLGADDDTFDVNASAGVWCDGGNDSGYLRNAFRGELYGGSGNDVLYLTGDCFDTHVEGNGGDDWLEASGNNYAVSWFKGGEGSDGLWGTPYNDSIDGGNGEDWIFAGAGNDILYAVDGYDDELDGGSGTDSAYLDQRDVSTAFNIEYLIT